MEDARHYFDFLAKIGLTKHMGSMAATRRLVEMCQIRRGQLVLDVGCGAGATPVYLVRSLGSGVVGVDLLERMAMQARERARSDAAERSIELAVADARRLPFRDDSFDAVIMESLNVFFEEKRKAMEGYVRVTKPGGYVGITEMTWLQPPSPELAAYYRRTVYADALEAEGWIELLEDAGLRDVEGEARPVEIPEEARGRLERYGCRAFLRVLLNTVSTMARDPASRHFLADVTRSLPKDFVRDVGYGVYVGRKS